MASILISMTECLNMELFFANMELYYENFNIKYLPVNIFELKICEEVYLNLSEKNIYTYKF